MLPRAGDWAALQSLKDLSNGEPNPPFISFSSQTLVLLILPNSMGQPFKYLETVIRSQAKIPCLLKLLIG